LNLAGWLYLANDRLTIEYSRTKSESPESRHNEVNTFFTIHGKSQRSRVGIAITSLSVVSFQFVYTMFSPRRKERDAISASAKSFRLYTVVRLARSMLYRQADMPWVTVP
jgi:hypothetical protein